jgi:phytoene desaturase
LKKKVIIIGSGVAGLATSVRLAKMGYDVHVCESNAYPGGKINSATYGGYRFDQGPSVFTGPTYLKEIYDLCGEDFSEFGLVPLTTSFNYFFNDGLRMQLSNKRDEIIDEISEKLGEDKQALNAYLDKAAKNYKAIAPMFIEASLHSWRNYTGKAFFKALGRLSKYKLFSTMNDENQKAFRNPKTVQLFNRFASYNGSDPYQAPAMLNMIGHLEINQTPYLPKNGMIQITDSLFNLAKKYGVEFHFNERVNKILVDGKKITGVETDKGQYLSDAVVSNMDVSFTYERLLTDSPFPKPEKTIKQEKSSSAIVFYWGIKRSFPELTLHNIFFSDDYKAEFDGIFHKKKPVDDPTIYINITSKYVEGDAPEGCENWFTMINSPVDVGQDWDTEIARIREKIIAKISRILGTDISELIEVEEVLEPRKIESRYHGKQGSIYGNASNNRYAAFRRHPNFSKQFNNLFFVGVSVHPGGGIPLALNSAKIACEYLEKRVGK